MKVKKKNYCRKKPRNHMVKTQHDSIALAALAYLLAAEGATNV
jgi:hypothetical protein